MYDAEENVVKIPVIGNNRNREGLLKLGRLREGCDGRKHLDFYASFSAWPGKPLLHGCEMLCRQQFGTDSNKTFDYYLIYWRDPDGYSSDEDSCRVFTPNEAIQWLQENHYELPDDLKKQKINSEQKQPSRHSSDFRSVHWHGMDHSFTSTQAAIVKELWEAWENGTPDIGQAALLEKVDSQSGRLADLFKGHKTYKQLIRPGKTKGSYRLIIPSEKK